MATELWPDSGVSISPLAGGITNENFKASAGGEEFVIRVFGEGAELLRIDRAAECQITVLAARAGVGPDVFATLLGHGVLVTRFIDGRQVSPEQMQDPDVLRQVTEALRRVHAEREAPKILDPFRDIDCYASEAWRRGVMTDPEFSEGVTLAREIETLTGYSPTVLCHGDLLNANFIWAGGRMHIVDWEYAGLGDPVFDLANLSVNHRFGLDADKLLLTLYQGHSDPVNLARIRLLRFVSAVREAAWSYLQVAISALDVDFTTYAAACLATMRQAADDPSFPEALQMLRRNPLGRPQTGSARKGGAA